MKRMLRHVVLVPLLVSSLSGCYVAARPTPPPPVREAAGPPPRAGWVWTPGHWRWNGRRYVWIRGHWRMA